jgi:4-hydroxy-3-polyprenylbenzoate decarboxylase
VPVSPVLEMTEIQTRLLAEGAGRAVRERASRRRRALADAGAGQPVRHGRARRLGHGPRARELREVGETLAFLRQPEPPGGWREALEMLPLLKTVMAMKPEDGRRAPCQEVVLTGDDIDLAQLPIQTCWPGEPAPLITWPLVVTKGPTARARGRRFQPRHLPHAGDRAEHDADALAQASRRRAAPRAGRRRSASRCPPPP